MVGFQIAPTISGGYYAFTDWNGIGSEANFVGVGNFATIFTDPLTSQALYRTFLLAAGFVVGVNILGLVLAVVLREELKSRNFLKSLFFLPAVLSPVVVAFVWKYVLDRDGILNSFLTSIGLESQTRSWLADPDWALWMVLAV
ncbi:carbohydrate ABC transporter permease, partial [Rhodococcus sp. NCIMB 12038]|uniref:carbohydrate ABC transporter permease n=1 Tax=Rhodococcus sp. NCIMB 12038 TaxID=933800 RepID=UPI000B56104E